MNLSDGGVNRPAMRTIGMKGLQTVLTERKLWHEKMSLNEARDIMWEQPDVVAQRTIIEQLCYDNRIVCLYQSKAHPVFNAVEV